MCPIVAVGFTEAKKATAVLPAQGGEQFVKADLDQARAPNDVDNRAHALADRSDGRSAGQADFFGEQSVDVAGAEAGFEAGDGVARFGTGRGLSTGFTGLKPRC